MWRLSNSYERSAMLKGVWGKKVGMTQVYSDSDKVVPVTVIDAGHWVVTQIKRVDSDGYEAVQVGCLRPRYQSEAFSPDWLKSKKTYFSEVREVEVDALEEDITVGQTVDPLKVMQAGTNVDVFGKSKGRGFQGVVKRYNFTGGLASHGAKLGRRPGARGFTRSSGEISKGKKTPGHMGLEQRCYQNLAVVQVEANSQLILVKGSVPGGVGSLVYMRKA
jgi:large subunit ribosomal protein L3